MKNDTQFFISSAFGKYFNFSAKSDPFLVFPSTKQSHGVPGHGGQSRAVRRLLDRSHQKIVIPLANSHMKMIR